MTVKRRVLPTAEDQALIEALEDENKVQHAQIITLREQRERLSTTLKELADLAQIRTTPHEHVPGIGNAVARARAIIREVKGEK